MLLVQWSDPTRVPELVPDQPKCAELGVEWADSPSMACHPRESGLRLAMACVQGLIQQLYSMPLEIRVSRIVHESCPGLRELQSEKITAHLRNLSRMLAPGFRDGEPTDAFDKSVTMTAAFAKAWANLWKAACVLPKDQGAQFAYARCLLDLGQATEADAILTKVIDLDPLSDLAEMAKAERRKLAHETMRASVDGGLRMDAVFYCLDALKKFGEMNLNKVKTVAFEIAVLGQSGLDINDPGEKYTLQSLPGNYSGLHLVALMYVGFKMLNPSLDGGIDLSREYAHARALAGLA